ncbi:type II toxin-antitoxin system RelE/ParE family toxin [Fulvivirgaceae bacterium BMA12]|uniref:Toxin n=1 Tax=Agaribacillus aureus TaxID=3051825 RepID=A0ABT8LCS4_9BACT|nr:type II toxin-antitoxin system RelE/ParE family toxin [Fulvivirgaceae bacterium BMA12]
MPKAKRFYELSTEADQDIDKIFDYTKVEFGFDQAVKYVSEFEDFFERLLDNPELGKKRDEIKAGLRSFPKAAHVIFYRVLNDRIRIVRVLHGSRDLPKFLDKPDQ